MHKTPRSHHALSRYLTPFYSFTLGLILGLVLTACGRKAVVTSDVNPTAPSTSIQATQPVQFGTQAHKKSTATLLPAIPDTPDVRTPSPLGVQASQLQGLDVTIWYPWSGATATSFQAILDEFNRTNKWGITVKSRGFEGFGSLDETVDSGLTTGMLPDVLLDYGYQARQWDTNGVLADLTPYVEDDVWGLSRDEQVDFLRIFWEEDLVSAPNQSKPRRLGIPFYRSAYVLFYNHRWAEELGFPDPPSTPEDFRVQACAAAEAIAHSAGKSSLGKGGWLISSDPGVLTGWIYAFGGGITNPLGAGYLFNTPETSQAFTYLKSMQASGCAWYDGVLDPTTAFANRQALFITGSLYDLPAQQAAFTQAGSGDEWIVIPFPSDLTPVIVTSGPSLLISNSTPAGQLASWLVIEWLIYPPNQAKFVQQLGVYPTRQSSLSYLIHTEEARTQWAQSLKLLPEARSEPSLESWNILRWTLSDATSQLFNQKFAADQVLTLIGNLDTIAEEVLNQVR